MHIIFLSPHSDPQANLGEPDSGGQCVYELELGEALSQLEDIKVTVYCRQTYQRPAVSTHNNLTIRRLECGTK